MQNKSQDLKMDPDIFLFLCRIEDTVKLSP